jgi:hypothetical protein
LKQLKKDIEYNYDLDIHLDKWDRLWITHNKIRITIERINNLNYISAYCDDPKISDNFVCNSEDESILYALYKYCKDVHKWGEFNNLN